MSLHKFSQWPLSKQIFFAMLAVVFVFGAVFTLNSRDKASAQTGYPTAFLTSSTNPVLQVKVTPTSYNGTVYQATIAWQRTLNAQGSFYVTPKADTTKTLLLASSDPAPQSGSVNITVVPGSWYRVEFYAVPAAINNASLYSSSSPAQLMLRKFFRFNAPTTPTTASPSALNTVQSSPVQTTYTTNDPAVLQTCANYYQALVNINKTATSQQLTTMLTNTYPICGQFVVNLQSAPPATATTTPPVTNLTGNLAQVASLGTNPVNQSPAATASITPNTTPATIIGGASSCQNDPNNPGGPLVDTTYLPYTGNSNPQYGGSPNLAAKGACWALTPTSSNYLGVQTGNSFTGSMSGGSLNASSINWHQGDTIHITGQMPASTAQNVNTGKTDPSVTIKLAQADTTGGLGYDGYGNYIDSRPTTILGVTNMTNGCTDMNGLSTAGIYCSYSMDITVPSDAAFLGHYYQLIATANVDGFTMDFPLYFSRMPGAGALYQSGTGGLIYIMKPGDIRPVDKDLGPQQTVYTAGTGPICKADGTQITSGGPTQQNQLGDWGPIYCSDVLPASNCQDQTLKDIYFSTSTNVNVNEHDQIPACYLSTINNVVPDNSFGPDPADPSTHNYDGSGRHYIMTLTPGQNVTRLYARICAMDTSGINGGFEYGCGALLFDGTFTVGGALPSVDVTPGQPQNFKFTIGEGALGSPVGSTKVFFMLMVGTLIPTYQPSPAVVDYAGHTSPPTWSTGPYVSSNSATYDWAWLTSLSAGSGTHAAGTGPIFAQCGTAASIQDGQTANANAPALTNSPAYTALCSNDGKGGPIFNAQTNTSYGGNPSVPVLNWASPKQWTWTCTLPNGTTGYGATNNVASCSAPATAAANGSTQPVSADPLPTVLAAAQQITDTGFTLHYSVSEGNYDQLLLRIGTDSNKVGTGCGSGTGAGSGCTVATTLTKINSDTTYQVTGLLAGTKYYYRVVAYNSSSGQYSDSWNGSASSMGSPESITTTGTAASGGGTGSTSVGPATIAECGQTMSGNPFTIHWSGATGAPSGQNYDYWLVVRTGTGNGTGNDVSSGAILAGDGTGSGSKTISNLNSDGSQYNLQLYTGVHGTDSTKWPIWPSATGNACIITMPSSGGGGGGGTGGLTTVSLQSGSSASVGASGHITVHCDYGVKSGYVGATANGQTCPWTGGSGTNFSFDCTAPSSATVQCNIGSNDGYQSRSDPVTVH